MKKIRLKKNKRIYWCSDYEHNAFLEVYKIINADLDDEYNDVKISLRHRFKPFEMGWDISTTPIVVGLSSGSIISSKNTSGDIVSGLTMLRSRVIANMRPSKKPSKRDLADRNAVAFINKEIVKEQNAINKKK